MKKGFRSYLNDFRLNGKGEYIYSGALYGYRGEKPLKRLKGEILLLSLLPAACAVVSGCIPAPGMINCFYVIIPWVLEIAAAFSLVWAAVKFAGAKLPLRGYIYESTLAAFKPRCIFNCTACILELISFCVFVIINGTGGKTAAALGFLLLKAISAAGGTALAKFAVKADFRVEFAPDRAGK